MGVAKPATSKRSNFISPQIATLFWRARWGITLASAIFPFCYHRSRLSLMESPRLEEIADAGLHDGIFFNSGNQHIILYYPGFGCKITRTNGTVESVSRSQLMPTDTQEIRHIHLLLIPHSTGLRVVHIPNVVSFFYVGL